VGWRGKWAGWLFGLRGKRLGGLGWRAGMGWGCFLFFFFPFFFNSFFPHFFSNFYSKSFQKFLNQLLNHTINQKPMHST
jgi:hypothetical protein